MYCRLSIYTNAQFKQRIHFNLINNETKFILQYKIKLKLNIEIK